MCNWLLEEIIYLVVLALPVAIECLTEGLQIKMSNVFIGRASGNRIDLMLSSLFIGQTVNIMTAYPIAEGFGFMLTGIWSKTVQTSWSVLLQSSIHGSSHLLSCIHSLH